MGTHHAKAVLPLLSRVWLPQDACSYVSQLAADMPHYAPEHALNGSFLHDDWRPELVRRTLFQQEPGLQPLQSYISGCM